MKQELMEILACLTCPVCKERMELDVEEEEGKEIVTGSLYCRKCDAHYPIVEYNSLIGWVPISLEVVRAMLELAKVGPEDIVCDLGCGDGRILIMAVKEFGARKAVGYEIRQDLYEDALKEIQSQGLQDRITLIRDDLLNADLSEASVITLYLGTTANEHLKSKLEREAKPTTRIASYTFPIKTWQADSTELCAKEILYLYVVPQAFQCLPTNNTKDGQ